MFVLADPAHGAQRHHKENAVFVDSYSEALELVRRGFSIRMSDGRSAASLVSPGSLQFIDEPVERIDDLWTYTMPEPPFPLEKVMDDLRKHLFSQASDLAAIAGDEAAFAFLGFEFDTHDGEDQETSQRIDLERFNITRIARIAYQSAFRPWPSDPIGEDEVDELEQIIVGSIVKFQRRHSSPLDVEDSVLRRTLLAAYYRWQIVDGCFLNGGILDQSATEAIAVLIGMPATAVRNAISRDDISLVKSKIDYRALIDWVVTRRNFAPLREDETQHGIGAWHALHVFRTRPLAEAFAERRPVSSSGSIDVEAAEQAILSQRDAGQMPNDEDLRRYAEAINVSPDTFILGMRKFWAQP